MFEFVQFVTSQDMFQMQGEQTRCLSKKCKCKVFKLVDDVMRDVYEEGFMPNYYWWTNHSEELPQFPPVVLQGSYYGSGGRREELKLNVTNISNGGMRTISDSDVLVTS